MIKHCLAKLQSVLKMGPRAAVTLAVGAGAAAFTAHYLFRAAGRIRIVRKPPFFKRCAHRRLATIVSVQPAAQGADASAMHSSRINWLLQHASRVHLGSDPYIVSALAR